MLCNIKQAGRLKASPMQLWLDLAFATSTAQTKHLKNLPVIY